MGRPSSFSLGLRREDSEQRDDELDTEVRLEIVVRLAAPDWRDGAAVERGRGNVRPVGEGVLGRRLCQNLLARRVLRPLVERTEQRVAVRRNLLHGQRHGLYAARLAQ